MSTTQRISAHKPGAVHRWSQSLIPTTREAPKDAEVPSHIWLHRAGYMRPVGAGIYDYLPLALRVLTKISTIIREELAAAGASELLLPALAPFDLYKDTKRDEAYGDNLFKLVDRKDRRTALAPTHEETITDLMRGCVNSYKALPLNLYQIQTKFRDEARPRAGLLRCREFLMKDAYSFHTSVDGPGGLNTTYDAMFTAYSNIFRRCGLDFSAVEAESGPIGGSASHEFMVNCDSGEDTVLKCPISGYAANVEKCEIGERSWDIDGQGSQPLVKHHTPHMPGIDLVAAHLKLSPAHMLKTIVFSVTGGAGAAPNGVKWVLATVRGDHDVNEGKVKAASGYTIVLADEKAARAAGFAIGYVSPKVAATIPNCLLLIDPDAAQGAVAWATGADENDHHVTGFNWRRDLGLDPHKSANVKVADVRNAHAGDPSPRAKGATLATSRGIEVGHIFKLGTKYSEAMGFSVLDHDQKQRTVIMGCYGIGVSRTMAACVEMSHDANGIIWPSPIAPYHVLITIVNRDDAAQKQAAEKLASDLSNLGVDVLLDDRDERPGPKFKDADLVGIPVRLTVGEKSLAAGAVEFKLRKDTQSKGENVPLAQIVDKVLAFLNA
ncbi:MAG TPA: proline--tRNA ligase [Phycisphaerales bacterium]|nr:proline--tRNA ligase [Phycisphaerales bacterium]